MSDTRDQLRDLPFTKMTGSGNDFVVFDGREVPTALLTRPEVIRAICHRHNGIGADGVVLLEPGVGENAPIRLRYFNRDGTLGELCGNATLCSTALSVRSGMAPAAAVRLQTDAGLVSARQPDVGDPEIDVAPVHDIRADLSALGLPTPPNALHVGFALVGVPHVVIALRDAAALSAVPVVASGRPIRQHASLQPSGANVNWVAPDGRGGWMYRTYERGVEDETLACGTGAIACAILLSHWGLASAPITLQTRSGRPVTVSFRHSATGAGAVLPSLRGEGRVVFRGQIGTLPIEA
jgi:diaminopimelate epimerase